MSRLPLQRAWGASAFAFVWLSVLGGAAVAQTAADGEPSVAESRSALQAWTVLKED